MTTVLELDNLVAIVGILTDAKDAGNDIVLTLKVPREQLREDGMELGIRAQARASAQGGMR